MAETEIHFCLNGEFLLNTNSAYYSGNQFIRISENEILLNGKPLDSEELCFEPVDKKNGSFELSDVTIGVQFHWERKENQLFKGAILFLGEGNKLHAINILPLEDYLISVISIRNECDQ